MKKLVSAAAASVLLAGGAFAQFSVTGNARVYSDVFQYETASENEQRTNDDNGEGTDDNGVITTAKDVKHADDVTIQAKGEKSGAKIVLSIKSNASTTADGTGTSDEAGSVGLTSYQLWTQIGGVRVDAGAYDQRLSKNLNNDCNWNDNYSATYKPGIWTKFGLKKNNWGADAGNITGLLNAKKVTNFQASGKLGENLTLRGVLFLGTDGTVENGSDESTKTDTASSVSNPWIFTPFALGATYKINDASQLAVVGKLAHIAQQGYSSSKHTPQDSVWTLHFDYYNKLSDTMEIEAAYTFGADICTNNGSTSDGDYVSATGTKAQDNDVFAHGLDLRIKDKLSDQLSLTGIVGINYIQSTAIVKRANDNESGDAYRDSLAKSYKTGAAGTLAYYATLGLDYKQNDIITYQIQTKLANTNLFAASTGDSSVYQVDYYQNFGVNIRPAILVNADKTSQFFAGLDIGFSGFLRNATGKNNTFKTTTKIPLGLRVNL